MIAAQYGKGLAGRAAVEPLSAEPLPLRRCGWNRRPVHMLARRGAAGAAAAADVPNAHGGQLWHLRKRYLEAAV